MMVAALLLTATATTLAAAPAVAADTGQPIHWVDDGIPAPLTSTPGDPGRGRAIVTDRQQGLCLLCHSGPFPEEPSPGNLATDLRGAGARWSEPQLRARIVDARRLDPASLMPAFHSTAGRQRVGSAWRGKPILDAQQVEDVVAFIGTLK